MKKLWLLIAALLILTACDHTDLSGDVIVLNDTHQVGEIIPLLLEVPDELSEIYRVDWLLHDGDDTLVNDDEVMIQGQAVIDAYDEQWIKDMFDINDVNVDRICLFIPKNNGEYKIELYGFLNQTNPQPITELEISID